MRTFERADDAVVRRRVVVVPATVPGAGGGGEFGGVATRFVDGRCVTGQPGASLA